MQHCEEGDCLKFKGQIAAFCIGSPGHTTTEKKVWPVSTLSAHTSIIPVLLWPGSKAVQVYTHTHTHPHTHPHTHMHRSNFCCLKCTRLGLCCHREPPYPTPHQSPSHPPPPPYQHQSPLLGGRGDVYWATYHTLHPETVGNYWADVS